MARIVPRWKSKPGTSRRKARFQSVKRFGDLLTKTQRPSLESLYPQSVLSDSHCSLKAEKPLADQVADGDDGERKQGRSQSGERRPLHLFWRSVMGRVADVLGHGRARLTFLISPS